MVPLPLIQSIRPYLYRGSFVMGAMHDAAPVSRIPLIHRATYQPRFGVLIQRYARCLYLRSGIRISPQSEGARTYMNLRQGKARQSKARQGKAEQGEVEEGRHDQVAVHVLCAALRRQQRDQAQVLTTPCSHAPTACLCVPCTGPCPTTPRVQNSRLSSRRAGRRRSASAAFFCMLAGAIAFSFVIAWMLRCWDAWGDAWGCLGSLEFPGVIACHLPAYQSRTISTGSC